MRYCGAFCAAVSLVSAMASAGPGIAQSSGAVAACRQIAGAPDAGAPVSREALASYFSTLAKARPHCEVAVIGPNPDPEALFHLAVVMQREGAHERALEVFTLAGEAGVAAAHTKLGDYYNFGIGPVRQDQQRAVEEYRRAMEGGDMVATSTMAIMYQLGRGVPQDFDKMIELLKASAEAGYHFSQFRLAELYLKADGIPQSLARKLDLPDPIKAAEYYEMAAKQGSQEARVALEKLMDNDGMFEDPAVRVKWLLHAAENGNAEALNKLGLMYEHGDGVEYDPARAAAYYIEALETGDLPVSRLRVGANGYAPRWDRETALEFQILLQERGLYNGALDAIVGPGTMGAARKLTQR